MILSDQILPFTIRDMECNLTHITDTLHVGEASPQDTLDWLEGLGVGPHLRELIVNVFGGHVYDIAQFLRRLPKQHDGNRITFNSHAHTHIASAVANWLKMGGSYKEIRDVLCEVARAGFVVSKPTNEQVARVLVRNNVCNFLDYGTTEFHVDPAVRGGQRAGLIPAGQAMRMHLAAELVELDRSHQYKNSK
jgi:hypothetical protein